MIAPLTRSNKHCSQAIEILDFLKQIRTNKVKAK